MDLVCRTPRIPHGGETVLGQDLLTIPGGKGANQAVAAARLGGDVHMVGRVGDDDFGRRLLAGLRENGVRTRHVTVTPGAPSGCAVITVDGAGENAIVVSPGANARVSPADVDAAEPLIRTASAVVLQLEIPLATVRRAMTLCRELGVTSILDPAPVPPRGLPAALYKADVLTPNEHEAALLAGSRRRGADALAKALLGRGPSRVVLKLGGRGALARGQGGWAVEAPAFEVKAVDTTAAGDAFTGALAVALGEQQPWADALRFANAAGALCCTKLGAQPALPGRAAVDRLLRQGRR
jgi:ribokinase